MKQMTGNYEYEQRDD